MRSPRSAHGPANCVTCRAIRVLLVAAWLAGGWVAGTLLPSALSGW